MNFEQKKPKTQRPNNGSSNGELELKDRRQEVPQVDDVVNEIDRLLAKTQPRKSGCGCGW
jgi:hypothetical protein